MKHRLALWCLLLCGSTVPGRSDPPPLPQASSQAPGAAQATGRLVLTSVPFTDLTAAGVQTHIPLVRIRLDDAVDATFIVDTGNTYSGITQDLAKRLGLRPRPLILDGKPLNYNGIQADVVNVPSILMGGVNFANARTLVLPDSEVIKIGLKVDGVIGMDFMRDWVVLFDFPARTLTYFYPKAFTDKQRRLWGFGPAATADIRENKKDLYTTDLALTGGGGAATETAVVDTGSYSTDILGTTARRLGLSAAGPPGQMAGVGYLDTVVPARVDTLRVGQLRLAGVPITYFQKGSPYSVAVLGTDVLSGYRVLLDFPNGKMYLAPADAGVSLAALKARGAAYGRSGDYAKSVTAYARAIALDPGDPDAWVGRGSAYTGEGDYARAIADYDQAICLSPGDADAYLGLGGVYLAQRDYDRAVEQYTTALSLRKDNPNTFYGRGYSYYEKADYGRAIADATEAIRLNPGYADAYQLRAAAYAAQGAKAKADTDNAKAGSLR